jgi:hypothetical protein
LHPDCYLAEKLPKHVDPEISVPERPEDVLDADRQNHGSGQRGGLGEVANTEHRAIRLTSELWLQIVADAISP